MSNSKFASQSVSGNGLSSHVKQNQNLISNTRLHMDMNNKLENLKTLLTYQKEKLHSRWTRVNNY